MKKLLIILCLPLGLSAQESNADEAIKNIRQDAQRNASDSACKIMLDDFYASMESDQGLANPKIMSATTKLYDYSHQKDMPNHQIAALLVGYLDALSKPNDALKWIKALGEETIAVYGSRHPLTYIYEGENYMNARKGQEARAVFSELDKYCIKTTHRNSAVAWFYIYQLETDKRIKQTWLSVLENQFPNHWLVKTIKK